ncbi:MAG: pilus assembly protein N-terminal domain-containing protein [Bryobacterales bacterium]|nr:pilus assembly protein N-terminal domain-containing protein [Acidobacteriota bacterium]MCB9384454.1 pilus assembly protein N-terminal domain-containing protein [Bryobacterales bacterium]
MTLSPQNVFRSWLVTGAVFTALLVSPPGAFSAEPSQQAPMGDEIPLTIGKSIVLDIPDEIQRVALTNDEVADAIAISTREVLINAKSEGVTTLVLWSRSGDRTFFTISVAPNIRAVQDHLRATFPGEQVRITSNRGVMTLNGKVSDPAVEERIISLLQGMGAGAVVSNLELPVPAADRQVLLKVKFLEVQRNALRDFGASLFSTGAGGTIGALGTQQFGGVRAPTINGTIGAPLAGATSNFTLSDTLNIFAFRPDLNIGAAVKLLQSRGLSELLAEPNVVATSGKQADLLVGGEFPVPVVQGGSSAGAVTVQFREFGIRIGFLPEFTQRGSIKMHVKPEVSALDYANALSLSGFLIPALATRRVETDVELMPGQSFVIGGLLDKRLVESISRIPGLSKIPLLGELFKSRTRSQNNTELLVIVTPEFPEVYDSGEPTPDLFMPHDFLPPTVEDPEYVSKDQN